MTRKKFFSLIGQHRWLLLLTLLAGFLRLYKIEALMRFIWDEGRDMLAIRNIIVNHDLTLFGPFNEIGGGKDFFGVFHYYLMLPALLIANFNPLGPAVWTALLGVAAVVLTYFWTKNWLGEKIALGVTGLMATSPLVVYYVRWPLNPNTTGFFGVLYLLSLQAWRARPRWWLSFLAGLLVGLLFQLHYFTIALAPAAFLVFFWQAKLTWRQKLVHCLLLSLGWLLPNLSFVIFDLTHEGFYRKILIDLFVVEQPTQFSLGSPLLWPLTALDYLWDISHKFMSNFWLGGVTFLVFLVWWGRTLQKGFSLKKADESFQLAISWLVFLLITALLPGLKDDYHSAVLWVAIPTSLLVTTKVWWQKLNGFRQTVLLLIIVVFLSFQNQLWRSPTWQENMPLIRSAAGAIAEDARGKTNLNIASFVDPDTRATRFRYFVINSGVTLLTINEYPQADVLYIITPHPWEETRKNPAWELETFRQGATKLIWQADGWTVFKIMK
jgi:hypothetical protein